MSKSKGAAIFAAIAAVTPILVAAVRGALDGWTPTGDDAFSGVRAWDIFTGHVPLLGTWSSASTYTQLTVNHPGPLQFDLIAIPVRLLGHGAGTAIGLGLINAAAVAAIAWLLHRTMGAPAATAGMALCACLSWSMGSEMLYDPWNPYATLFPFALFLVSAWCLVAGDRVALLVMAFSGSYVLQTHLSYSLLVPGMALFAVATVVVRLALRRRADREAWPALRRRALRWGGGAVLLTLVCWAQPIYQQFTTDEQGNLTGLLRSASERARTPGLGRTLRALGGTVAVPPAWLPPSYGSPAFELDGSGLPTWLAGAGLVVLALLMAGLGRRAWRRGSSAVAAGALTGLVALVLGLATTLRAPIVFEMVPTYFRWMWPMGMVLWLVVAVAVLDEVRAWSADRAGAAAPTEAEATSAEPESRADENATPVADRRPDPRVWPRNLALPGLVVAVVAGVAAVPRVDHGTASPPWTIEIVDEIDEDVAEAVEGKGPLLVELSAHASVLSVGPALFGVLQDADVGFYVEDWPLVRQLGEDRRWEPDEDQADMRLRVTGDTATSSAREGERLVASYLPLSRDERHELARLNRQITDILVEQGIVWSGDAEQVYEHLDKPDRMAEMEDQAEGNAAYMVESGLLRSLWEGGEPGFAGHPLLDTTVYTPELLDPWADLQGAQDRTVKVFLSKIEPPPDEEEDE